MKILFLFLSIISFLCSFAKEVILTPPDINSVKKIKPEELWERLKNEESLQILDVGESTKYDTVHIPLSKNITYGNNSENNKNFSKNKDTFSVESVKKIFNSNETLIVYGEDLNDWSAYKALIQLKDSGEFKDLVWLKEGLKSWKYATAGSVPLGQVWSMPLWKEEPKQCIEENKKSGLPIGLCQTMLLLDFFEDKLFQNRCLAADKNQFISCLLFYLKTHYKSVKNMNSFFYYSLKLKIMKFEYIKNKIIKIEKNDFKNDQEKVESIVGILKLSFGFLEIFKNTREKEKIKAIEISKKDPLFFQSIFQKNKKIQQEFLKPLVEGFKKPSNENISKESVLYLEKVSSVLSLILPLMELPKVQHYFKIMSQTVDVLNKKNPKDKEFLNLLKRVENNINIQMNEIKEMEQFICTQLSSDYCLYSTKK